MDVNCSPPTCHYSDIRNKCTRPNSYIENIAWCKRNNLEHQECKKEYQLNKRDAKIKACERYYERLDYNLMKQNKPKRVKKEKVLKPKKEEVLKGELSIKTINKELEKIPSIEQQIEEEKKKTSLSLKTLKKNSNIKSEPLPLKSSKGCKEPKCMYSDTRLKCVRPNPYIELYSACSSKDGKKSDCIDIYNSHKTLSKESACDNYEKRMEREKTETRKKTGTKTKNRLVQEEVLHESLKPKRLILEKAKNVKEASVENIEGPKKSILRPANKTRILGMKRKNTMERLKELEPKIKTASKKLSSKKISPERQKRIDSFIRRRAANKIKKFLKPFTTRTSVDIYDRIKYTELIINYLADLTTKQCLEQMGKNQYKIGDKILLPKQIGTQSVYGVIYKSKGANIGELFRFATKLMKITTDNRNEVRLTTNVTKIVLNNINPHFPIVYRTFECENPKNNKEFPELTRRSAYYVFLNELANGDLKMFLHSTLKHDSTLLKNTLAQIIISTLSFHNLGYSHNDSHWGNFLYHKVNKGGYIHYNIYGEDYYLENMGYLWVIWDYGFYKPLKNVTDYYKDMNQILYFFKNEKHGGVVPDKHVIAADITVIIVMIKKLLNDMITNNSSEKLYINDILKIAYISLMIKKSNLPLNAKIINPTPYVIGDRLYVKYN